MTHRTIPTLGVIELSSIAKGFLVCDRMLKKAEVRVLRAVPLGCGKFLVIITGSEADLFEAVEEGRSIGAPCLVGWTYLANIHPQVVAALAREQAAKGEMDALGILECRSLASLIRAADIAVKTADVRLLELTFDLDMGGKGFLTLTGDLADLDAALEAAEAHLKADGTWVNREIIARPHQGMREIVLGG